MWLRQRDYKLKSKLVWKMMFPEMITGESGKDSFRKLWTDIGHATVLLIKFLDNIGNAGGWKNGWDIRLQNLHPFNKRLLRKSIILVFHSFKKKSKKKFISFRRKLRKQNF